MRTFIFLLCTMAFSLNTENSIAQGKVKIVTDKAATVDEVFKMIMNQTKYSFIYPENLFKNLPKVQLKKGTIRVDKLINHSISGTKFNIVLSTDDTIIIKENKSVKQTQISGKVTDNAGLPIPGVTILIKGTKMGKSTDINGEYSISVPNAENVLVFSAIGFVSQEQVVGNQTTINITLLEDVNELEEVLLVGYGQTKKKDLTGAVSFVKSEDIQKTKAQSFDASLHGQISGVQFTPTGSSGLGGNANINVRGFSQITGDNQPLYVIDGVPLQVNFQSNDRLGLVNWSDKANPLLALDPSDIERMDVLKDASATAIYGSRGANGVIIITTKKGKRNHETRLSYTTNATFQENVREHAYVDGDEYREIAPVLAQRILDASPYPESQHPFRHAFAYNLVNNPDDVLRDGNTDWYSESQNQDPLWITHKLTALGGSENTSYYLSAGTSNQEGITIGTQLKRYTFSASIDTNVKSFLKVGGSFNYSYSKNRQIQDGGAINDAESFRPDFPIYEEDGSYSGFQSPTYFNPNPLGSTVNLWEKTNSDALIGNVYSEISFLKNFTFKTKVGVNLFNSNKQSFSPTTDPNAAFRGGVNQLVDYSQDVKTTVFENTLTYDNKFNQHNINAVVGLGYNRTSAYFSNLTYRDFPDDVNLTNFGSATEVVFPSDELVESGLNSLFGRVNYIYQDKYLATLTARLDNSTKFGPGNQRGFFPSAALAWNIHNESFMEDVDFFNRLKFRVSAGRTGSDNLPSFSYLTLANTSTQYNGQSGFQLSGFPNKNIKWETTDQFDVGLEFQALNNRLFGEIGYFDKATHDIILVADLPPQSGFSTWNYNLADVSNKGVEIELGGDIIRQKDFNWNSSFNITFLKNKVEALNGGVPRLIGLQNGGVIEGEELGVIWGYDVQAIAQTQEEIDALNANAPSGTYYSNLIKPGDYIYRDVNGDGEITLDDETALGSIVPEYYGGWNNSLTYKNFDFGFNFGYSKGVERTIFALYLSNGLSEYQGIRKVVAYDTWTEDNPNARFASLGSYSDTTTNSRKVYDASYITLSYVGLGYNMPKTILNKIGVHQARLSINVNNLFIITDFPEGDPFSVRSQFAGDSRGLNGSSPYSYPTARTYTLGLNVTF